MSQSHANWKIPLLWPDETVFVVGGGSSVRYQPTDRLRGRKVIAINSSYEVAPFADFLFFGDHRWHEEHRWRAGFKDYLKSGGEVVTVSYPSRGDYLRKLDRITPSKEKADGLTTTRTGLSSQRTSFQGAINLAAMLGANRIVLLGLDGTRGVDGKTHHHTDHKWPMTDKAEKIWQKQLVQLRLIVEPLKQRGVQVFNTSPISKVKLWPFVRLERLL